MTAVPGPRLIPVRQVPPAPGGPGNHKEVSGEPAGSTKESKKPWGGIVSAIEAIEALEEALDEALFWPLWPLRESTAAPLG